MSCRINFPCEVSDLAKILSTVQTTYQSAVLQALDERHVRILLFCQRTKTVSQIDLEGLVVTGEPQHTTFHVVELNTMIKHLNKQKINFHLLIRDQQLYVVDSVETSIPRGREVDKYTIDEEALLSCASRGIGYKLNNCIIQSVMKPVQIAEGEYPTTFTLETYDQGLYFKTPSLVGITAKMTVKQGDDMETVWEKGEGHFSIQAPVESIYRLYQNMQYPSNDKISYLYLSPRFVLVRRTLIKGSVTIHHRMICPN